MIKTLCGDFINCIHHILMSYTLISPIIPCYCGLIDKKYRKIDYLYYSFSIFFNSSILLSYYFTNSNCLISYAENFCNPLKYEIITIGNNFKYNLLISIFNFGLQMTIEDFHTRSIVSFSYLPVLIYNHIIIYF